MNTDLLRKRAGDLNAIATGIKNQYDFSMVKQAALNSLAENGVDASQAEEILAGYEEKFTPGHAAEMLQHAATFEKEAGILSKSADVIDELSAKLQSSEETITDLQKSASVAPTLDALKSKGDWTDSDWEALKSLPEGTLNKIASSQQDPWDLGKASNGQSSRGVDPFVDFCLS